jgi:hypothetical protein
MLDKIQKALQDVTETIKTQAGNIGDSAKEKTYRLIEEWLKIFPKLEIYGLQITSFSLGVALSPSLEVELKGAHEDFPTGRIDEILDENRGSAAMFSVFNTIKMTYNLHRQTYANLEDPLIVKIRIRLSPEIKVYIGKPIIE